MYAFGEGPRDGRTDWYSNKNKLYKIIQYSLRGPSPGPVQFDSKCLPAIAVWSKRDRGETIRRRRRRWQRRRHCRPSRKIEPTTTVALWVRMGVAVVGVGEGSRSWTLSAMDRVVVVVVERECERPDGCWC